MLRRIAVGLFVGCALTILMGSAAPSSLSGSALRASIEPPAIALEDEAEPEPEPEPEQECCKVCRKGKACGDSCIARSKTCHQPPGCACDG